MARIADDAGLREWLEGRAVEFASVLAARAALRSVCVLDIALHEEGQERRRSVVLPYFRALAASNFAGAWPGRAGEIIKVARAAGDEACSAINALSTNALYAAIEAEEVIPEVHEQVRLLQDDARALRVAERAVDAAVEATRSAAAVVDVGEGIGSPAAAYEAAVSAARLAHSAIDGIHGDTELYHGLEQDDSEAGVASHIESFWNAIAMDVEWIESSCEGKEPIGDCVAGLSTKALWLNQPPVWASRRWADFKDRLPGEEGWCVWVGWYEARVAGRELDMSLQADLLKIPNADWQQGPRHINGIIAMLIESRSDPLFAAVAQGFEEIDAARQVSSIDLQGHRDRIQKALPDDPYLAIGATKDMLEAIMRTILDRRGHVETEELRFPDLTTRCLTELGLRGTSRPASESERHLRRIASSAQKMIETANELRNSAGTGHGRVVGSEPVVTAADGGLVASSGLILAAWLLRHDLKA